MNKRAEIGIGAIMTVFIAVIVGVILFQAVAQEAGNSVNTVEVANTSLTTVVNGTAQYLPYRALDSVVIYNETGVLIIGTGNYTVTSNVIHPTTGELSVSILPTASEADKTAWKVSGTAQPRGYIAESGGRAMANLIAIFFALAIAVVAMMPVVRERFS